MLGASGRGSTRARQSGGDQFTLIPKPPSLPFETASVLQRQTVGAVQRAHGADKLMQFLRDDGGLQLSSRHLDLSPNRASPRDASGKLRRPLDRQVRQLKTASI